MTFSSITRLIHKRKQSQRQFIETLLSGIAGGVLFTLLHLPLSWVLGPFITAVTSIPFTYFMANDPYYFGVLPILAQTAAAYGVDPVEIARASV